MKIKQHQRRYAGVLSLSERLAIALLFMICIIILPQSCYQKSAGICSPEESVIGSYCNSVGELLIIETGGTYSMYHENKLVVSSAYELNRYASDNNWITLTAYESEKIKDLSYPDCWNLQSGETCDLSLLLLFNSYNCVVRLTADPDSGLNDFDRCNIDR